jgi:hypothetical protein
VKRADDLCAFFAREMGQDPLTVRLYCDYLRKTDLFPRDLGGRGKRGGAIVTPEASTMLLIALLSSDSALACARSAALVSTFQFSHLEFRNITPTGDVIWRVWEDETQPGAFPERYFRLLLDAVQAHRASVSVPPSLMPLAIGVSRRALVPFAWIEGAHAGNVAGGALLIRAVYTDPDGEAAWRSMGIGFEKTAAVPAALLKHLAEFLGSDQSNVVAGNNARDDLMGGVH